MFRVVTGTLCMVLVTLKWVTAINQTEADHPTETLFPYETEKPTIQLPEEHEEILRNIDGEISKIKSKVGKLYSQNTVLLHKLSKLDEYIKKGADMETRYIIEILGYPFEKSVISPEIFLEHLATALNIEFNQNQVTGLRIVGGQRYTNARLIVEFGSAKQKRKWVKAFKDRLHRISFGNDREKVFGNKDTYKFIQHQTMYLQDFLPTLCEMHGVGPVTFAINDYISPYRKRLLSYAKLLGRKYEWRFVWVSEGDIFMRRRDKEPGNYIRSEKDFRVVDWRLENEAFFWKTINECNMQRREFLRSTTRRILPWMDRRTMAYVKNPEYKESLLNYKRKFDDQMRILLQGLVTSVPDSALSTATEHKYQFLTMRLNLTRTYRTTIERLGLLY